MSLVKDRMNLMEIMSLNASFERLYLLGKRGVKKNMFFMVF